MSDSLQVEGDLKLTQQTVEDLEKVKRDLEEVAKRSANRSSFGNFAEKKLVTSL